jgi:hypothetical protein
MAHKFVLHLGYPDLVVTLTVVWFWPTSDSHDRQRSARSGLFRSGLETGRLQGNGSYSELSG